MNKQVTFSAQIQDDIHHVEEVMLAQARDQHPDLKNALELIVKSGGKRIRPTIALLVGEMLGAPHEKIISMAASIELLHTGTLVHDDLIDGALLRRGMPTLNAKWSPGSTVLTGDFIFAQAANLAAGTDSIPVMKIFSNTLATIVNGEIEQLFEGHCQVDRKSYYHRIFCKTASLFETSSWSAALIAQASEDVTEAIRGFGYNVGMAFQIIDDILDFTGDQETIGKPVGSDFLQGLITLPAIYYIEDNPNKPEIDELLMGKCSQQDKLNQLVKEIRGSSAIQKSHEEAWFYVQKALDLLHTQPECPQRETLQNLAKYIVDREL